MRIAFASIALVLSALVLTVPAWAQPAKPSHFVCHKITEQVGGLTKTCYYDCGGWEGGQQQYIYDHCPDWTVRWRLNRNTQFGPHPRRKATTG
jgi:hypothetical protein